LSPPEEPDPDPVGELAGELPHAARTISAAAAIAASGPRLLIRLIVC
jgi:hypothetical protein